MREANNIGGFRIKHFCVLVTSLLLVHVINAGNLALNVLVVFLPKIGVAQAVQIHLLLFHLGWGQIEEGLHRYQRVPNVMA